METLFQDLRLAARGLLRAPTFTLVAVLTLALGIGANTAIFSVLYGVLLRPLPYPDSGRLVSFTQVGGGYVGGMGVTYGEFQFLAEHSTIFESFAASTSVGLNLFSGLQADRVDGLRVSRDYFRVLGVAPALGRAFSADEDQENGPNAAILSHALWVRRFASDPAVLGRAVTLDGKPFTIVGVMPEGFQSEPGAALWSTIAQVQGSIGSGQNLVAVGRLKAGLTLTQANAAFAATEAAYKTEFSRIVSKDADIAVASLRELDSLDLKTPVRVLFGAIGMVLLIACANVANLMLGRAVARGRELAVRVALGATRGRLVRLLLTESLLLSCLGGAVGLLLATWGLSALLALVPPSLATGAEIRLDGWALAFALVISLLTGLLFGLAPAWQVSRAELQQTLKDGAGRTTGAAGHSRLRHSLVVGEMAVSVVLLVGAGLLIRTFANLVRSDAGFDTRHVLSAEIWLTGSRYDSTAKIAGFYRGLTERLTAIPGVQSASVVEAGLPLVRGGNLGISVNGEPIRSSIDYRTVTPEYFQTLGIALRRGRTFAAADAGGSAPVFVVNESFARRYLGGDSALGRSIRLGGSGGVTGQIVGIVGDVKSFVGARAPATVYLASAQTPAGFTRLFSSWYPIHVLVRTAGDAAAMRTLLGQTIREADPQVPVGRVRDMDDVLAGSLAFQRFVMLLLGVFAALALALASVGLYGVISNLVSQRTHEIGVRMALGARSADVLRLVLGRGMALVLFGVAIGLGGAVFATRLIASQLYNVKAFDPATLAVVTGVLVTVALAACYVPARRASRTDPLAAIRSE